MKVKYRHIDEMEIQLQISVLFRWLYRDRKVFPGPCEDRTHALPTELTDHAYKKSRKGKQLTIRVSIPAPS